MSSQLPPVPRPGEGEPIVFMDITLGGESRLSWIFTIPSQAFTLTYSSVPARRWGSKWWAMEWTQPWTSLGARSIQAADGVLHYTKTAKESRRARTTTFVMAASAPCSHDAADRKPWNESSLGSSVNLNSRRQLPTLRHWSRHSSSQPRYLPSKPS